MFRPPSNWIPQAGRIFVRWNISSLRKAPFLWPCILRISIISIISINSSGLWQMTYSGYGEIPSKVFSADGSWIFSAETETRHLNRINQVIKEKK
jgi:hypothetical protein